MYNGQLLVVDTKHKILYVYDDMSLVKTINDVWTGKNGCATEDGKYEGDMKTPLGEYDLGVAFGCADANISYPYIKVDDNSYWVDDVDSKYYNCFIQLSSRKLNVNYPYVFNFLEKDFKNAEHLMDYEKVYKYAVFIEYNSVTLKNNPMPGKGSAIFLHCHENKGYTGGCISIKEENMKWILNFLDYDKRPKIIIK